MSETPRKRHIRVSYGLHFPQAAALSLGPMIAVSVFLLLGGVVEHAGSNAYLLYLLTMLFVLVNQASTVELSLSVPNPGGTYAIVHDSEEGGYLAFITGWGLFLSGSILTILLAKGFAFYAGALLEGFLGLPIPPYLLTSGIMIAMSFYNILGVKRKQPGTIVIILLALILSALIIHIPEFQVEYFSRHTFDWGFGISFLMIAFAGLEIASSRFSEMVRPQESIPRTIFISTIATGALAAVISAVAIGFVGSEALPGSTTPMADIGHVIAGSGGRAVMLMVMALFFFLALNRSFMTVVREMYTMTVDGFWPSQLGVQHPRYRTPAGLIILTGAAALIFSFFPIDTLARLGSLLYLLVLMVVHYVLAQRAPNPSAAFRMPFHPWIPYFLLLIDALLLLWWGTQLLIAALLIALGSLIYLLYSSEHHLETKEGVTIFKAPGQKVEKKTKFVVLVPIANPATAEGLLNLAGSLARQQEGKVIALRVITVPPQAPLSEGKRRAASERVLLDRAIDQANQEDFQIQTMTRVGRDIAQGILDTAREEDVDQILLGWQGISRTFGASLGRIIDPVIQNAPCDVLIAKGEKFQDIEHILVPTAGGPNASTAAAVAADLSHIYQAQVTGLYVQIGRASPTRTEENKKVIHKSFEGLTFFQPPQEKVLIAEGVIEGILGIVEDYDLVLIGASEERLFDQFAFGNIPQRIATQVPTPAVMVKHFPGAPDFWLKRALRGLFNLFPTLDVEEQIEVREDMRDSAQPGVNYFVLIILSSIMATLGLLLNSPAVVIGAMLVAPLMSPVLSFSLGIVLGELRLIRLSLESIFKGLMASILVSVMVGLLSPFKELTPEILSRTQPTLLDLFIALASGMAGAYAISRKDVSAALPGVAIAAALAPPLSVVGIGIAIGNPDIAGGAFLLFVTNIISINLAGVIVFSLLGIRPQNWLPETQRRIRRGVIGVILMVVIIAIPLGLIMNGIITQTRQQQIIHQELTDHPLIHDGTILDIEREMRGDTLSIVATMRSTQPIDQETVDALSENLEQRLNQPLILEITTLPTLRSE